MATWEDGPEYAPVERPALFRAPGGAVALEAPPRPAHLAAGAPPQPPARFDGPDAAPLESLVAPEKDVRDPRTPYDVVSAALTDTSAWSATHHRAATQPFGVSPGVQSPRSVAPFDPYRPLTTSSWTPPVAQLPAAAGSNEAALPTPAWGPPAPAPAPSPAPGDAGGLDAPAAPGWFPPVPQATPPAARPASRLFVRSVVRAMNPVVVGLLATAAASVLLGPVRVVAPVAYGLAVILGFLLIRTQATFARTILGLGLTFVILLGFVTLLLDTPTPQLWWDGLVSLSALAAALSLAILGTGMVGAVRNGEVG